MASRPSTPNRLLVFSLSFKNELNASALVSSSRILICYYLDAVSVEIFSNSYISHYFSDSSDMCINSIPHLFE